MKSLNYILSFAAIILMWQAASLLFGENILPTPLEAGRSLVKESFSKEFWEHVGLSSLRAGLGIFLSFIIAFPLGLIMGSCEKLDKTFSPFIFLTYPIPKILFLPVFLILLGLGESPKIILIVLSCGYQILIITRDSLRLEAPGYILSFQAISYESQKKTFAQIFFLYREVLVPAALPAAISALRLAAGTAVAVLFMAESFATDKGLGFMIMEAWGGFDLARMFSGIIAMSLLGLMLYLIIDIIEKRLCRWAVS